MKDEILNNKDFYTKQRIIEEYPLTLSVINRNIKSGTFPKPDIIENKKQYWHRINIEAFLKVYNKVKVGQNSYTVDYEKRREEYLNRARKFVNKYNISSTFQYRDMLANGGKYNAPSTDTLFCYSITFEEILTIDHNQDSMCFSIINLISDDWMNAKELAFRLKTSERTIFRKLDKLRELGHGIESSRKGLKMASGKKSESN